MSKLQYRDSGTNQLVAKIDTEKIKLFGLKAIFRFRINTVSIDTQYSLIICIKESSSKFLQQTVGSGQTRKYWNTEIWIWQERKNRDLKKSRGRDKEETRN